VVDLLESLTPVGGEGLGGSRRSDRLFLSIIDPTPTHPIKLRRPRVVCAQPQLMSPQPGSCFNMLYKPPASNRYKLSSSGSMVSPALVQAVLVPKSAHLYAGLTVQHEEPRTLGLDIRIIRLNLYWMLKFLTAKRH
jgi:hypothetical protein